MDGRRWFEMSIAELRGKLSDLAKTEDMLTSDVFGALELLGDAWLRRWIKDAKGFGVGDAVETLDSLLPEIATPPKFIFWPWLPSPQKGVAGCEPDVLVFWGDLALLIEMKYGAAKSGAGLEENAASVDEKALASDRHNLVDQLGRQWCAAQTLTKGEGLREGWPRPKRAAVLFVTQDFGPPLAELDESLASTTLKVGIQSVKDVRFFWTSCRKLHDSLETAAAIAGICSHETMVQDRLRQLLERKSLVSFRGFPELGMPASVQSLQYVVRYFDRTRLPNQELLDTLPAYKYSGGINGKN